MARIRSIKPEFPQSETIGRLSRDARLLFIQLWTIVDDSGRARAASRMLASLLYPYDDDAPSMIEGWLAELEGEGCVRRYEVDGTRYLDIPNWLKHQKIDKPSASKFPPFDEGSRIVAKPREESTTDLGSRILDLGEGSRTEEEDTSPSAPPASDHGKYAFEAGAIRLTQKDFDQWKRAYEHLSLEAELLALADWAGTQPKWFHAVSGALSKRNREIGVRKTQASTGPPTAADNSIWRSPKGAAI